MENQVTLNLNYPLNEYVAQNELKLQFSEGATLGDLFLKVGIPSESVGFAVLATVLNDTMVHLDYILQNGDFIRVFPLVNGG
ncbi:hypothetical protein JCM17380_14090 [Desulfosporosinus burensis]